MSEMNSFLVTILGGIMLFLFLRFLNQERRTEGKKPYGCISTIVISILVILFWYLTSRH